MRPLKRASVSQRTLTLFLLVYVCAYVRRQADRQVCMSFGFGGGGIADFGARTRTIADVEFRVTEFRDPKVL